MVKFSTPTRFRGKVRPPEQPPVTWAIARPEPTVPPPRTVWCWRIRVGDIPAEREGALRAVLSAREQVRADRLWRVADRRNFIAAHAGLLLLLAAVLGHRTEDVQLTQNDTGKPMLVGRALEFNLSHSGEIVLIALASGVSIGVDVEQPRAMPDRAAIARRFLHPGEVADLAMLTGRAAELAFFRCWTRKEAVAKALGLGLSLPLDQYRVSCRPEEPTRLLVLPDIAPAAAAWSLIDLDPSPDYVGALAVPLRPIGLVCRTLDLAGLLPG
jgi:4'-phosphopantetheinyl transferase